MSAKKHWKVLKHRLKHRSAYANCRLCEEWEDFANFEKFYNDNCRNEDFVLDKDLLVQGNRTYGPEYCRFIPHHVNVLFNTHQANRGNLPVGVYFDTTAKRSEPYKATLSFSGRNIALGYFSTPEEAFEVYRKAKLNRVKRVAIEALMAGTIPLEIYLSLIKRDVKIDD